jgi:hypothetical protein
MIGNKYPGIAFYLHLWTEILKSFDEILAILIASEYFPSFNPPNHDVVQNTGSI